MRARLLLAPLLLLGPLAACGDDKGSNDEAQIKTTVEAILAGEASNDAKAVVTHFTDPGLKALYGSTRAEMLKPDYSFDQDGPTTLRALKVAVDGDTAIATADVKMGHGGVRVPLHLTHKGDDWLVNAVDEPQASPAPAGVADVKVTAVDYGFELDTSKLGSGVFRLSFHNAGKESHEMALFRVPTGTSAADATAAIATVHGDSYDNVPAGYEAVDHVTYADPGGNGSYLVADPLEAGQYAFVCLIPKGGFDPTTFEPVDPTGAPHVTLGMYAPFTVTG